jgi:ribonucleotide monophosphatase NagD (HAD superfamily)
VRRPAAGPAGFLIDLDGTVYQAGRAIPGAAAALDLGLPRERIAVIGDDLETDVLGAREAGMTGIAVRTGKHRPEDEERARRLASYRRLSRIPPREDSRRARLSTNPGVRQL